MDEQWINRRLRSEAHVALDHIDRGLDVFKLKPSAVDGYILTTTVDSSGQRSVGWASVNDVFGARLYIQEDEPDDTSNYLWLETDSDGRVTTMWKGP